MLVASRRFAAAVCGRSHLRASAAWASPQQWSAVSTSTVTEAEGEEEDSKPDPSAESPSDQAPAQTEAQGAAPSTPPLEDMVLTPEEEADFIRALDADIAEMEAEIKAGQAQLSPAEVKAFWHEVLDIQREEDQPELEAQLAKGELDFDLDQPRTISFAGPGRPGWGIGSVDEEGFVDSYEFDAIGGAVHENEKNALLSDEAKEVMYDWSKNGWNVPELAEHFRIRQQRVMAILALKEMEHEEEERTGQPLDTEIQHMMEGGPGLKEDGSDNFHGIWECDEAQGVGERHVKMIPRAPHYEFGLDLEKEARAKQGLDRRRQLPVEQMEWEGAIEEENMAIKEFRQNLDYNLGKRGPEISRESRSVKAPKRPKEGWSLVVKPAKGSSASQNTYVAKPDAESRDLTPSERVYLARMKSRPRRRII